MVVPAATVADAVLVPADTGDGLTVFVVPLDAAGVTVEANETTNREIHGTLTFDGTTLGADAVVGTVGDGATVAEWTVQRARLASGAIALGACAEALRLAAEYTSEREQFGVPIASFQAVGHRTANCYIDTKCLKLVTQQAASKLDLEQEASVSVSVAKSWCGDASHRVSTATQHLHGGMGVDRDYPLWRYALWAKQNELLLGNTTYHLEQLGEAIAEGDFDIDL